MTAPAVHPLLFDFQAATIAARRATGDAALGVTVLRGRSRVVRCVYEHPRKPATVTPVTEYAAHAETLAALHLLAERGA